MVFNTICVGSIPATLVISFVMSKKLSNKQKISPSSWFLWSLKKKKPFWKKKKSTLSFLNNFKNFTKQKSCLTKIIISKRFTKKNFINKSRVFFTSNSVLNLTPQPNFGFIKSKTYISSSLISKLLFSKSLDSKFFYLNPSYNYLNQYKLYSFHSNLVQARTFLNINKASKSNTVFQKSYSGIQTPSVLKKNQFTNFMFKALKKKLVRSNYFVETFFLPSYNFNSHKLIRLDAYSKYYFLKDSLVQLKNTLKSKTYHFYSNLASNESSFEYNLFPIKKSFALNFKNANIKWKRKKRKKLLKGFKHLKYFPTLYFKLLFLMKKKLIKQFKPLLKTSSVSAQSYLLKTTKITSAGTLQTLSLSLNFNFQQKHGFSSLLLKYLLVQQNIPRNFSVSPISTLLNSFFFTNRYNFFKKTNLISVKEFNFVLQKKILKIINFDKFRPNVVLWYYTTIIRFIEFYSGKKVFFKLNPFIENSLTFSDLARCNLWFSRIYSFQRLLGPKIFLKDSLKVLHLAFRFKDVTFLSSWIRTMLQRMDFWKYRLLFRYLKYLIRNLFFSYFKDLNLKGIKLKLKGKISVAGNARTRKLLYSIGNTSHSTFDNKIAYDLSFINTFTGVLGFQIWFFF